MSEIFKKINLKDQSEIVVLNPPESFEAELSNLGDVLVRRSLRGVRNLTFSLDFVIGQKEADSLAKTVADKAEGDAVIWFAYPKKTSKNYKSELSRDSGWDILGKAGFVPVRQVAIDVDWSALRFRRTDFIKSRH